MDAKTRPIDLAEIIRSLVMPLEINDPQVCSACNTFIHELSDATEFCENCVQNTESLGVAVSPVTPITLYCRESETRTWITHYKPDIDDQHGEPTENQSVCASVMTQMVQHFFAANEWLLADVDQVLIVPSTRRLPPHPLETIIQQSVASPLLVKGGLTRTSEELDHRSANSLAYQGSENLAGRRILLIDDVYASGARLQSAAVAAQRAGAQVLRSVVVARRINPGFHPVIQEKWDQATSTPFRWDRVPQTSKIVDSNPLTATAEVVGSA